MSTNAVDRAGTDRGHPLGVDALGRDVLSRIIYGARVSLEVGIWYVVFPGVALLLMVLAFNLVGDGLLDALNPRGESR